VLAGQLLDLRAQHCLGLSGPATGIDPPTRSDAVVAEQVVRYKTALYTVARPVQIGALLGGADADVVDGLARFGVPLGRAFQWRDDMLDVFGEPTATGKAVGQDLRDGKRTLLVAIAFHRADPAGARILRSVLGDAGASDTDIERARQVLVDSGAAASVERAIDRDHVAAVRALDTLSMTASGRAGLTELARLCVERDR
jgi:geranylgeranyl diphosphate synthase type I